MSHGWELDRSTQHWLYLHWRADGRLLYVGLTRDPTERFAQHSRATAWFAEIDRYELLPSYPNGHAAYQAEKVHIQYGRPLYNRKHNPDAKRHPIPAGSWLLSPAKYSQLVYETVKAAESAA